jgi:hypothetical protein
MGLLGEAGADRRGWHDNASLTVGSLEWLKRATRGGCRRTAETADCAMKLMAGRAETRWFAEPFRGETC